MTFHLQSAVLARSLRPFLAPCSLQCTRPPARRFPGWGVCGRTLCVVVAPCGGWLCSFLTSSTGRSRRLSFSSHSNSYLVLAVLLLLFGHVLFFLFFWLSVVVVL